MLILVPTEAEARLLWPDAPCPSDERPIATRLGPHEIEAALVGFGPAAAGALAALALARSAARPVVLVGAAGTYRPDVLPVGAALLARRVLFADLGRGEGADFVPADRLGFDQAPPGAGVPRVSGALETELLPGAGVGAGLVLTVARASGTPDAARARADAHAGALAEDMESFAVALAAARLGIRVAVLRGISNRAGEAGPGRLDLGEALRAVRDALIRHLGGGGRPPRGDDPEGRTAPTGRSRSGP